MPRQQSFKWILFNLASAAVSELTLCVPGAVCITWATSQLGCLAHEFGDGQWTNEEFSAWLESSWT